MNHITPPMTRICVIRAISEQMGEIGFQYLIKPEAMALEAMEALQSKIADEINLLRAEFDDQNRADDEAHEAKVQAECNAGAAALRAICSEQWAS